MPYTTMIYESRGALTNAATVDASIKRVFVAFYDDMNPERGGGAWYEEAAKPTFRNVGNFIESSGATSLTVPLPPMRERGNLLIAIVAGKSNQTHTGPADWTLGGARTGSSFSVSWRWRIVDGTEIAPSVGVNSTNVACAGQCFQFSGNDVAPIGNAEIKSGSGTSHQTNGITGGRANSLAIYLDAAAFNTPLGAPPMQWLEKVDNGGSASGIQITLGVREIVSAGSQSGPLSLTGGSPWVMFQQEILSLNPANPACVESNLAPNRRLWVLARDQVVTPAMFGAVGNLDATAAVTNMDKFCKFFGAVGFVDPDRHLVPNTPPLLLAAPVLFPHPALILPRTTLTVGPGDHWQEAFQDIAVGGSTPSVITLLAGAYVETGAQPIPIRNKSGRLMIECAAYDDAIINARFQVQGCDWLTWRKVRFEYPTSPNPANPIYTAPDMFQCVSSFVEFSDISAKSDTSEGRFFLGQGRCLLHIKGETRDVTVDWSVSKALAVIDNEDASSLVLRGELINPGQTPPDEERYVVWIKGAGNPMAQVVAQKVGPAYLRSD